MYCIGSCSDWGLLCCFDFIHPTKAAQPVCMGKPLLGFLLLNPLAAFDNHKYCPSLLNRWSLGQDCSGELLLPGVV